VDQGDEEAVQDLQRGMVQMLGGQDDLGGAHRAIGRPLPAGGEEPAGGLAEAPGGDVDEDPGDEAAGEEDRIGPGLNPFQFREQGAVAVGFEVHTPNVLIVRFSGADGAPGGGDGRAGLRPLGGTDARRRVQEAWGSPARVRLVEGAHGGMVAAQMRPSAAAPRPAASQEV
jgi:hypothetical protein